MTDLSDRTPKAQRLKLNDGDFFIADTHFGHTNIINYENRPFAYTTEMDEYMIEKWNQNVVSPNQIVYHLGDFSWGSAMRIKSIIEQLNGTIVLLRGNHDRARTATSWRRLGIHKVIDGPVQAISDSIGFVLSHEPIVMPQCYPHRINLHGHTHSLGGQITTPDGISENHYCVSVELLNYTPILLDEILTKLYRHRAPKKEINI